MDHQAEVAVVAVVVAAMTISGSVEWGHSVVVQVQVHKGDCTAKPLAVAGDDKHIHTQSAHKYITAQNRPITVATALVHPYQMVMASASKQRRGAEPRPSQA